MQTISYQPELSPALRVVVGNVDYTEFKDTLKRIDRLLIDSGVEAEFVQLRVIEYEKEVAAYARKMGKGLRKNLYSQRWQRLANVISQDIFCRKTPTLC